MEKKKMVSQLHGVRLSEESQNDKEKCNTGYIMDKALRIDPIFCRITP